MLLLILLKNKEYGIKRKSYFRFLIPRELRRPDRHWAHTVIAEVKNFEYCFYYCPARSAGSDRGRVQIFVVHIL